MVSVAPKRRNVRQPDRLVWLKHWGPWTHPATSPASVWTGTQFVFESTPRVDAGRQFEPRGKIAPHHVRPMAVLPRRRILMSVDEQQPGATGRTANCGNGS
jgi:hypothetical protein